MSLIIVFIRTTFIVHPISGKSMEDTLNSGDWVLINKRKELNRYGIVAFSDHLNKDLLVKRIIGQPGDSYIIQNNVMILDLGNSNSFQTTIQIELEKDVANELRNRTTIPENAYFVMGDNVDISNDSRSFGFVSNKQIEGRMGKVLWSKK